MDKTNAKKIFEKIYDGCYPLIKYYIGIYNKKYDFPLDCKDDLIQNTLINIYTSVLNGTYDIKRGKNPPCGLIDTICSNKAYDYWRTITYPEPPNLRPENPEAPAQRHERRNPKKSKGYHTAGNEGIETGRSDENGEPIRKPSPSFASNSYTKKELSQELRKCIEFKWDASAKAKEAMLMFLADFKQAKISQILDRSDSWVTVTKQKFVKAAVETCPELILYIEEL
ncbi:hypothetical protein SAMN02746065_1459 [Desulfocicer vacuolatum DSM 3385]|uniref:Uncharacterized protein n=1 Tax=Desulfocicer vacuolatum DSM 3385 TaxID=1121400 RepID=A0A1W2ETL5_9BACT|nr:sigma-70 family RNA polymerase sigma factor [Desulfocicer vacuolatum]SMD13053.1 hypothetical protein SAMN02746065_1459 [Desulfocicer vacuolatum DSM 3385]